MSDVSFKNENTQADFNRQKAALESAEVGTVDDSGRCVLPASSARSSSASRIFASRRPPAGTASSADTAGGSARRSPPRGGGGGASGATATADAVGAAAGSAHGIIASRGAAVGEPGEIHRAVVLGYVIDGGGGRGGAAPGTHYLVEVETVPPAGGVGGAGSRTCYKR